MEQLITTVFWSSLIIFVYVICVIRLLSRELKNPLRWLKEQSNDWRFVAAIVFVFLFAPLILLIYILGNIVWKVIDFLLK